MVGISDRRHQSYYIHNICIAIFIATYAMLPLTSSLASSTNNKASAAAMTRRAMEISNKANNNPIYAKEACKLWKIILNEDDSLLPLSAMPAAHGIYAAALVRIGRDKDAIVEYKKSLNYLTKDGTNYERLTNEEADIRMGLGKSLQRMLRYEEAASIFEGIATKCADINDNSLSWLNAVHSESVQNAALCSMRVGDLDSAVTILEKYKRRNAEVDGMHGTCLLLQQSASSSTNELEKQDRIQKASDLLKVAAVDKSVSPLYKWIYHTKNLNQGSSMPMFQYPGSEIYLSFAKINNSPFDDFSLLQLDDKILLHYMMKDTRASSDFWPQGYILPTEYESFLNSGHIDDETSNDQKKWIIKERSGYGSNGNTIVSKNEVQTLFDSNKLTDPILCQRIVEPPMLLNGLKFSLRVYVVYFPRVQDDKDAEVYISTQGLAKFAAKQYDITSTKSNTNDDQYMTNSGRGDGRSSKQSSLQVLKSEFQKNGLDYEQMWNNIEQAVQLVMQGYLNNYQHGDSSCRRIGLLNIPKILGFDFILDSSSNPFLLEVNRYPGLEARGTEDKDVKQAVVYDAWSKACDYIDIRKDCIQNLCPKSYKGSSLTRISIT